MKVLKQLSKEFLLPSMLALGWTFFNLHDLDREAWDAKKFVNVFGPTFFFVSWLVSQWHRVKKQQKVETGLSDIEKNVQKTLHSLDEKAQDLAGYITGGESVCYLIGPTPTTNIWSQLVIAHVGKHPLYEINARITDLDQWDLMKKDPTLHPLSCDTFRQFGNLVVGHVNFLQENFDLGQEDSRRFNIFFTARNGAFTQLLRCRRVEGTWVFATKVVRGDTVYHEEVSEGFPRAEDGTVNWEH
jgi:hypothetical protein